MALEQRQRGLTVMVTGGGRISTFDAAGLVVTAVALLVGIIWTQPGALAVAAVVGALTGWRLLGSWLTLVLLSFAASLFRSIPAFGAALSPGVWQALQFGAIAAALVLLVWPQLSRLSGSSPSMSGISELRRRPLGWAGLAGAAFVGVTLASTAWSASPRVTLVAGLASALMLVFLIASAHLRWRDGERRRQDVALFWWAGVAAQGLGLLGYLVGNTWSVQYAGRYGGLFANANFSGMLSALMLPVALVVAERAGRRGRWLVGVGATILLTTLLISGSRGGLLSAVGGVLAVLLVLRWSAARRWLVPIVGVGIGSAVAAALATWLASTSPLASYSRELSEVDVLSGRSELYLASLRRFAAHPILGTGFNTGPEFNADRLQAHNIVLTVATDLGLLGLIPFLIGLVALAVAARPFVPGNLLLGGAVAVLLNDMAESSLFGWGNSTALMSWLILIAAAMAGQSLAEHQRDFPRPS